MHTETLGFACYVRTPRELKQAAILFESIRKFAGGCSQARLMVLVPTKLQLDDQAQSNFKRLKAEVLPFKIASSLENFYFGEKASAAATAEAAFEHHASQLLFLDCGSLFLQDPSGILLAPNQVFGYRPVDHTLIASVYDHSIDDFWQNIYSDCEVSEEAIFPMTSSVDQLKLRPYFNAGFLWVRPEKALLRRWQQVFEKIYQKPVYQRYYAENKRYEIFMHQAVLAGVILNQLKKGQLKEFQSNVNYPYHMHTDYPTANKPALLDTLISLRYETSFDEHTNWDNIPASQELITWLMNQFT